ncbi:MAG TPA: spermidine synthase [Candidatus Limnocylindria bacterium]|nr:spermidine synthase [Candidatus Limnocylindria bacterium]
MLRDARVRLFLTSATLLFVELLLIRWVPANVVYVGFFNNFLLLASFLGIGIGILLGRRLGAATAIWFAPIVFALVLFVSLAQVNVKNELGDIWFATGEGQQLDINFIVLPCLLILTTTAMAFLAVPLGPLLRAMPPLRAYAIDIAGAMAGIALFAGVSLAGLPPSVWFTIAGALVVLVTFGRARVPQRAVAAAALAGTVALCWSIETIGGDVYSPYYRLALVHTPRTDVIFVNGVPFQAMFPADAPKEAYYDQVYRWFPGRTFERALIIGAGSGTDVSVALAHGVGAIDAVEIDPGIQAIGQAHHPDRPYTDPRVTSTINDGRAFLRNSSERYDLILFAVTDSLTLVSSTSNLRLESFLFTEESFASARDHLTPDGIFVMYNYYRQPWLVQRYANMVGQVFGSTPITRTYPTGDFGAAVIAHGPLVRGLAGGPPPGDTIEPVDLSSAPRPATDDWPFPYLQHPGIAPHYLLGLAIMIGLAALSVGGTLRYVGLPVRGFGARYAHFFLLGVAFLLLETRSIVTFSLLFGTTWYVNALVFFAILASVLAAVAVNSRLRSRDPRWLYAGLAGSLLLAYLLPPATLLVDPPILRYAVGSAIAFAPVFFANLVFTFSFRDSDAADLAFGANLVGAMVGGVLEWSALIGGYQALLVVVAGVYLLAWMVRPAPGLAKPREVPLLASPLAGARQQRPQ